MSEYLKIDKPYIWLPNDKIEKSLRYKGSGPYDFSLIADGAPVARIGSTSATDVLVAFPGELLDKIGFDSRETRIAMDSLRAHMDGDNVVCRVSFPAMHSGVNGKVAYHNSLLRFRLVNHFVAGRPAHFITQSPEMVIVISFVDNGGSEVGWIHGGGR